MDEWYCYKCKEMMKEEDILMVFMDISRFQPGLKCPKCGVAYMTEKTVVEVLVPGEEEIESKF